jgi:hypothetical protein
MMTKKVISLFLLAVFAVSLISAGVIARDRIDKEAHNRQVELSVEYGQILEVAGQGNHSYEEVLDNLQLAGVTGILYKEQTIIDLEQQVWTVSGNQLLAGSDLDDQLKTQVVPEYIYLATRDKNLYTRISKQFAIKVHEPEQIEIPGRLYLVGAKLSTKQLANVLGLPMPGLILGTLAALGWLALLVTGNALVGRKFLALAATIIFPSLGILLGLKGEGSGLKGSVLILLRTSLISLCGALLMVGLLSDLSFMLKLNEFSGVKLAHVAPLIIIACVIVWLTEKRETVKVIIEFLASNIKVWYALVVGIMTVALLIYILRTGNDAPVVSTLELQFRGWLEKVLKVRPRTKEFLIGHPLLLLTFYLGYRHRFLPILLLGSIGQISLVNTFAHIHTPLLISVVRAFNGLWLGIIIGIVLIMLFRIVLELGRRNYYG